MPSRPPLSCAACGEFIRRVARFPKDRAASARHALCRYRCADVACGWEGLLARPAATSAAPGCAWGQPGRQPYRGTTEQALTAAGLPPEVVQLIAAQRQAGHKSGRLEISRNAIRQLDGPRVFNPRSMAMSFGLTLCLRSRVNFAPGHVEPADLYETRDATRRLHSVMVPDVCGNVIVLGAGASGGVVTGVAGALAERSEALATVAEALVADAEPGDPADPMAGSGAGAVAGADADADAVAVAVAGSAVRSALAPGVALDAGAATAYGGVPGRRAAGNPGVVVPVADVGSAFAARSSTSQVGVALWQGLRSSAVPREVARVGLKRVADGLARSGETVRAVAALPSDHGLPRNAPGHQPGVAGATDSREVPEPGSLACVLVALAVAGWVGRRRALRQTLRQTLRP